MTTITIEIPDDLAAKIDLATLPILLRELVGHKAVQLQTIEESDPLPRSLYREITDFLAGNPTTQQIMAFKISAAAQERLENLLDKNREEALSPGERAELDTYLQLSEWLTILKARARSRGSSMIANDQELQGTQERIAFFYRLLAQMRVTATTPEEYHLFSNSYLAEIERMHAEVLTYLKRHASEPVPAEAA